MMNDIVLKLQNVFRDVFDNDELTIDETTSANDIAEWDSLAHIRLLQAVQDEFEVEFAIDEIFEMKNVGDMIKLIYEKR